MRPKLSLQIGWPIGTPGASLGSLLSHYLILNSPLIFSCTCPPGYTGLRCETNVDDCEGNKCQVTICSHYGQNETNFKSSICLI